LVFTLGGAFADVVYQYRDKRLKQEAIIGILYAFYIGTHGAPYIKNRSWRFGHTGSTLWKYIICKLVADNISRHCCRRHTSCNNLLSSKSSSHLLNHLKTVSTISLAYSISGTFFLYFHWPCDCIRSKDQWRDTCILLPHHSFGIGDYADEKQKTGVLIIAMLISILGGFFGLNFSFHYDFPAGSSIVVVLGGYFSAGFCV